MSVRDEGTERERGKLLVLRHSSRSHYHSPCFRLATDRFYLAIERMKVLEASFVDSSGNYLAEKGELLYGRYFVEKCCGGGAF